MNDMRYTDSGAESKEAARKDVRAEGRSSDASADG